MPNFDISVVLKSDTNATGDTDFRNGEWSLYGSMTTLTISDDDGFGLGDNNPFTETGAPATIQAVNGDTSHPLVGTEIFAKYIRADTDFDGANNTPDAVFLGTSSGFDNFAVTAYPGSGWSMQDGDSYSANSTSTTATTGGSWSREAALEGPPCFTPDGWIETDFGFKRISDLRPGDLVQTRDNGLQPVNWILSRTITRAELERRPHDAAICVRAGAFGPGNPTRDLWVSPYHLMLMRHGFNDEYLMYAKDLVAMDGVFQTAPVQDTTYIHLLMDRHEVVRVNGTWSESFQISPGSIRRIGRDSRAELIRLFPHIDLGSDARMAPVRDRIAPNYVHAQPDRLAQFRAA